MIDVSAMSRHGQAAINALPVTVKFEGGETCRASLLQNRTGVQGTDGGIIWGIGGELLISKAEMAANGIAIMPRAEDVIQVKQSDNSFLAYRVETVMGDDHPNATEIQVALGAPNK